MYCTAINFRQCIARQTEYTLSHVRRCGSHSQECAAFLRAILSVPSTPLVCTPLHLCDQGRLARPRSPAPLAVLMSSPRDLERVCSRRPDARYHAWLGWGDSFGGRGLRFLIGPLIVSLASELCPTARVRKRGGWRFADYVRLRLLLSKCMMHLYILKDICRVHQCLARPRVLGFNKPLYSWLDARASGLLSLVRSRQAEFLSSAGSFLATLKSTLTQCDCVVHYDSGEPLELTRLLLRSNLKRATGIGAY